MKIAGTEYTLKYQSLDIYISGCKPPHCVGCHNPETWDFSVGVDFDDSVMGSIGAKVHRHVHMIKNIMIFGGEPLDSDHQEVIRFLTLLKGFNRPIWLFTRYDLDDIPIEIKQLCDYIKTGAYLPKLSVDNYEQHGIELATSNQKVLKKGVDF